MLCIWYFLTVGYVWSWILMAGSKQFVYAANMLWQRGKYFALYI